MATDVSLSHTRFSWAAILRFKKPLKRIALLALAIYFIPYIFAVFVALGLWDVSRNRDKSLATLDRYFFGNGLFTWLLSPFNLLLDVLCLPYRNKGIYELSDLPQPWQDEIQDMLQAAHEHDLVGQLQSKLGDRGRGMIFFKWYGKNMPASVVIPDFHRPHRYIRTIGVSIFNKKQSTGKHFGPLRVTLRLLYNINRINSDDVYIQVGDHTHRWRENPLFIFDDTLQHQSCNQSDEVRYCLFVDILRPSLVRPLMSGTLSCVRLLVAPFNSVFYKKWSFMK